MKTLLSFFAFLGLVAGGSGLHAADLSGTWTGAFDFQGSSVPLTFHLTETGNAIAGDIEGLPTTPTQLHNGDVEGSKVTFWADTDYQGQMYKLEFTGQVSNSAQQISFTLATDDGSWSSELVAQKSEAPASTPATQINVTGTWKGSFEFEGAMVPVTLQLEDAGDTVTGTVTGMLQDAPEKAVDLHDGRLEGERLTFWLNTDYQGQTYKIVYTGTVSDGKIQFTFGTDDDSWSSEMTVEKVPSQAPSGL